MTTDKDKFLGMAKLDPDTGEEIETSDEEKAEALDALKRAFIGGRVVFPPDLIESAKAHGLSPEEIEAMMAHVLDLKQ